jgi:hypothetical protein
MILTPTFIQKLTISGLVFDDDIESAFEHDDKPAGMHTFSQFLPLSQEEMRKVILEQKNKTSELDAIPTHLLKLCLDELLPVISRIINLSLSTCHFPNHYKTAIIKPLIKKPNLDRVLRNYRPVSNLSFISKLIEEAVCQQISEHISINNLADANQSAYKRHHSTETALLKVSNDILLELDDRNIVFMNFLYLSAAFDTLDHQIMLRRLEVSFGIEGPVLQWFRSYLVGRSVKVNINGHYSDITELECSTPQGSKIGPRMYSDYTRPLGRLLSTLDIWYHAYADDTQVSDSAKAKIPSDQVNAVSRLQSGIQKSSDWMFKNKLKINQEKTEFLIIASRQNQKHVAVDQITLDNTVIHRTHKAKNLGVTFDSEMNMQNHIREIRRKCFCDIKWLWSVRKFMSENSIKTLVHALIISRLDYCNSLLYGLPKQTLNQLQTVMNAAARLITLTPRDKSATAAMDKLHWLPVHHRIDFKILSITYKALNGLAPSYICDLIEPYTSQRPLRSIQQFQLKVPKCNLKYGERSFSYAAPVLWNSLPLQIKCADSFQIFKKLLKTHLFRKTF